MASNTGGEKEAKGFIPHPDGRRVVIHYHHAKDTLPPGTLKSFLEATRWNEDDLGRLGLISN
jgi:hypothetical protein